MPQSPGSAVYNVADLVAHHKWRHGLLERCAEEFGDAPLVRVMSSGEIGCRLAENGGRDHTRFYDGDPDAEAFHLLRHAFSQSFESPLRRGVRGLGGIGDSTRHRSHVDNAAAAPLAHPRQNGLYAA